MIIGLTGYYCSGKDAIAEYISKKYEYKHYSLSDILREMMKEKGIDPSRKNLIAFGTELREENGNGVLARKVLKKIGFNDDCCITSIRHSEEVEELRKRKDFVLVNVAAPRSVRFERMQKRKRLGDPQTLKKFTEFEEKESQTEGSGQQLGKTADMADITFVNDSNDVSNLGTAVEKLLKDIKNV
ncbi:AAA family ATPase [Candidatus Endomicrobiellum agilis]|uniref:AAA family ATPase n=1 Tax=Candidatus Endomicrobiellum agilis TaxID=3238957 RepID=UPI0035766C1C|nr:AAA family ATPase [Endomicrobium sp.]MCA6085739.1 AAA family ATPase [Endomicrobium sp.]